jgi:hypothetical protein
MVGFYGDFEALVPAREDLAGWVLWFPAHFTMKL